MKFSGKGITNDYRFWIAIAFLVAGVVAAAYGWSDGAGPMVYFFAFCLVVVGFSTWLYGTGRAK